MTFRYARTDSMTIAHRAGARYLQAWMAASALFLGSENAAAAAPIIFSQPAYESPVRGDPGDLLLVPGEGFASTDTVIYQAITDTTQPLTHPARIPTKS